MTGSTEDDDLTAEQEIEQRAERQDRLGERFEQAGVPMSGWSIVEGEFGWVLDWPGCPLIVREHTDGRITVSAHLGEDAVGVADDEEDLAPYVRTDLGDLRLEFDNLFEVAWLVADVGDGDDLRALCERLATRTARVVRDLRAAQFAPPITDYEERIEHGPW